MGTKNYFEWYSKTREANLPQGGVASAIYAKEEVVKSNCDARLIFTTTFQKNIKSMTILIKTITDGWPCSQFWQVIEWLKYKFKCCDIKGMKNKMRQLDIIELGINNELTNI